MSEGGANPPATGPDGRPLGPDGKPLPGPQQMQQVMAQRRMAQQQAQVDEVVGIMKNNVEKVLERDQKLSELDERAAGAQLAMRARWDEGLGTQQFKGVLGPIGGAGIVSTALQHLDIEVRHVFFIIDDKDPLCL